MWGYIPTPTQKILKSSGSETLFSAIFMNYFFRKQALSTGDNRQVPGLAWLVMDLVTRRNRVKLIRVAGKQQRRQHSNSASQFYSQDVLICISLNIICFLCNIKPYKIESSYYVPVALMWFGLPVLKVAFVSRNDLYLCSAFDFSYNSLSKSFMQALRIRESINKEITQ